MHVICVRFARLSIMHEGIKRYTNNVAEALYVVRSLFNTLANVQHVVHSPVSHVRPSIVARGLRAAPLPPAQGPPTGNCASLPELRTNPLRRALLRNSERFLCVLSPRFASGPAGPLSEPNRDNPLKGVFSDSFPERLDLPALAAARQSRLKMGGQLQGYRLAAGSIHVMPILSLLSPRLAQAQACPPFPRGAGSASLRSASPVAQ